MSMVRDGYIVDEICRVTVAPTTAGSVLVTVAGEFDAMATTKVVQAVEPHLAAMVTVDLGGASFIDSAALQCLVRLQRDAEDVGGELKVGSRSSVVERTVTLCGLQDILLAD